jgi:anaerobic C4-dicarboxylate transporter
LQLHEPVSISKISLLAPGPTLTITVQCGTTKTALAVLSVVFCFKKKLHATDKISFAEKKVIYKQIDLTST